MPANPSRNNPGLRDSPVTLPSRCAGAGRGGGRGGAGVGAGPFGDEKAVSIGRTTDVLVIGSRALGPPSPSPRRSPGAPPSRATASATTSPFSARACRAACSGPSSRARPQGADPRGPGAPAPPPPSNGRCRYLLHRRHRRTYAPHDVRVAHGRDAVQRADTKRRRTTTPPRSSPLGFRSSRQSHLVVDLRRAPVRVVDGRDALGEERVLRLVDHLAEQRGLGLLGADSLEHGELGGGGIAVRVGEDLARVVDLAAGVLVQERELLVQRDGSATSWPNARAAWA